MIGLSRGGRTLPQRFDKALRGLRRRGGCEVKDEIDLRTGALWTHHPKAQDLLGDTVVEPRRPTT